MLGRERGWITIIAAAARLAAIYAVAVLVLLIPLMVFVIAPGNLREVLSSPVAAAAGFLVGFFLLAIARLYGFALFWILLLWWWLTTLQASPWPLELLPRFVVWTTFAAPLYALTAIGLGANKTRSSVVELLVTTGLWATAIALALRFSYLSIDGGGLANGPYRTARLIAYSCGALPVLLSVRELVRVGRASWITQRHSRGSLTSA
jgi:hypothetical protein